MVTILGDRKASFRCAIREGIDDIADYEAA
jgi:hypothetical protein